MSITDGLHTAPSVVLYAAGKAWNLRLPYSQITAQITLGTFKIVLSLWWYLHVFMLLICG